MLILLPKAKFSFISCFPFPPFSLLKCLPFLPFFPSLFHSFHPFFIPFPFFTYAFFPYLFLHPFFSFLLPFSISFPPSYLISLSYFFVQLLSCPPFSSLTSSTILLFISTSHFARFMPFISRRSFFYTYLSLHIFRLLPFIHFHLFFLSILYVYLILVSSLSYSFRFFWCVSFISLPTFLLCFFASFYQ